MILLWEVVVHLTAYETFFQFWPAVGFSCAAALLCTVLMDIPKFGRVMGWVLPPVLMLIYGVQLIYYDIFGSFLSLAYVSVGGEAVTTFWTVILASLGRCALQVVALIAPLVPFYLLHRRGEFEGQESYAQIIAVICAVAIFLFLRADVKSQQQRTDIDAWIERYGVLASEVMELRRQLVGEGEVLLEADSELDLTAGGGEERNILEEMDFAALSETTEDEKVRMVSDYVASSRGTAKNAYTGMFQDYNLIVVCAEAFSPYLVDQTLTPTLYRLSHEGFIFRNFYNSFQNLTTNGEYSLCMGLMPDVSRLSFATSSMNYVPLCLGNIWTERGGPAYAYHNNAGTFYNRINTHTNMGYDFRAIGCGLDMQLGNPTSDLEMMQKSVDDYIDKERFHAYYMTYSGHAEYTYDLNQISLQNQPLVEEIEGSEQFQAYYACQLELERALTYLLERLEEKGIADRTVIVLTGDHMPYGLPEEDYERLAGDAAAEPFWQYRNSFICWSGGMEESVVVDEYCCTQDILPTLLNLFGFDYDSRLLTGRDVLADCTHAAVLKDGSFLTKAFTYDSRAGEISWAPDQTPDEEYAQDVIDAIQDQFFLSAAILDTDYYRIVYSTLGAVDCETPNQMESIFTDIEGTWYEASVEELTRQGILLGNGIGTYNGDRTPTRAEMIATLFRSLQLPVENVELPYTDLETGAWYTDALCAAWKAGLLAEGETEFRPGEMIMEDEVQDILTRTAAYLHIVDGENWAASAVAAAMEEQAKAGWEGEGISRGAVAFLTVELLQAEREPSAEIPAEPET